MGLLFLRMAFDTWPKTGSDAGRTSLPTLLDSDPPLPQAFREESPSAQSNSRAVISIPMKPQNKIRSATAVLAIVAFVWLANLAMAADKGGVDPTGTWKLTSINAETKAKGPERTMKLKLEGGKVTGTIANRSEVNGKVKVLQWPVIDIKVQGANISFTISHPPTVT